MCLWESDGMCIEYWIKRTKFYCINEYLDLLVIQFRLFPQEPLRNLGDQFFHIYPCHPFPLLPLETLAHPYRIRKRKQGSGYWVRVLPYRANATFFSTMRIEQCKLIPSHQVVLEALAQGGWVHLWPPLVHLTLGHQEFQSPHEHQVNLLILSLLWDKHTHLHMWNGLWKIHLKHHGVETRVRLTNV